jgi:hypothetical protein
MHLAIEIVGIIIILMILGGIGIAINSKINRAHVRKHATVAYAVVMAIHASISIWNGFYGPIYGATNDALEFHKAAVLYFNQNSTTDLLIPGWVYSIFLAIVYELISDSWAIGCLLSTVVLGLLCIASINLYKALSFKKNAEFIDADKATVFIILLIGLIPASIVLTSITMREVYQMLFLCLLLLFSVKFIQTPNLIDAFLVLLMLAIFAAWHLSFIYYGGIYLITFIFFQFRRWLTLISPIVLLIITLLVIGSLFIVDVSSMFAIVSKFIEGTGGAEEARAYYGLPDISANIFSIASFIVISFFNYMVRPFPWEMTSIIDLTTLAENTLRVFFIWRMFVLRSYFSASISWTIFAALLLELLWGMGTLNWGTGQRHHLVVWPLFVVAYYAMTMRYKAAVSNVKELPVHQTVVA